MCGKFLFAVFFAALGLSLPCFGFEQDFSTASYDSSTGLPGGWSLKWTDSTRVSLPKTQPQSPSGTDESGLRINFYSATTSNLLYYATKMDDEIDVIADTTAMGDPVEVEYHLTFYSATIDDKDAIPQEAAIKVLYIALVVIVVGGILNYVLKKRRKR